MQLGDTKSLVGIKFPSSKRAPFSTMQYTQCQARTHVILLESCSLSTVLEHFIQHIYKFLHLLQSIVVH